LLQNVSEDLVTKDALHILGISPAASDQLVQQEHCLL
jgi:hypothetical protein